MFYSKILTLIFMLLGHSLVLFMFSLDFVRQLAFYSVSYFQVKFTDVYVQVFHLTDVMHSNNYV